MQFSIEVLASQVESFLSAYQNSCFANQDMQDGIIVLVPHVNGKPYKNVIEASKKLIANNITTVPHLAVRNLSIEDDIEEINQFLTSHTTAALLLGGDNNKPKRFYSVIDFLNEQWRDDNLPIKKIYFSVFPEGHPYIGESDGHTALEEKINWANKHKIPCGGFSQICLEAEPIIMQNELLKSYDFEFYNSFVAPCKIPQLIKLAAISGVKNAMNFLKKHNMLKMLSQYDSDSLVEEIRNAPIKAEGLHCYAFGNYVGALEKLGKYKNNYADIAIKK